MTCRIVTREVTCLQILVDLLKSERAIILAIFVNVDLQNKNRVKIK
jgi:hypothetical protein